MGIRQRADRLSRSRSLVLMSSWLIEFRSRSWSSLVAGRFCVLSPYPATPLLGCDGSDSGPGFAKVTEEIPAWAVPSVGGTSIRQSRRLFAVQGSVCSTSRSASEMNRRLNFSVCPLVVPYDHPAQRVGIEPGIFCRNGRRTSLDDIAILKTGIFFVFPRIGVCDPKFTAMRFAIEPENEPAHFATLSYWPDSDPDNLGASPTRRAIGETCSVS